MTYSEMLHRNMVTRQAAQADRAARAWQDQGNTAEALFWTTTAASLRLSLEV